MQRSSIGPGRCRRGRRACTTPGTQDTSRRRCRCRPSAVPSSTSRPTARTARRSAASSSTRGPWPPSSRATPTGTTASARACTARAIPSWRAELEILVGDAGDRLAFLTLPKAESAAEVARFLDAVALEDARRGLGREIPVSVLVETHGAVRDAWTIAALPGVASLDFGTLDFVSAHHGAIPAAAMESPGQFDHPLVRRAKCETAAAALAHDRIPAHGITRAIGDPQAVYDDARRARAEFGFLRMWSIHPAQIDPILRAMQPDAARSRRQPAFSPRRRPRIGRRWPLVARCTTSRRTVTTGACSSAQRRRVPPCRPPTPTTTSRRTHGPTGRAQRHL